MKLAGLRGFVRKMHHQNLTFSEERCVNGLDWIERLVFLIGNSLGDGVCFICRCVIRELTVSPYMRIRTDSRKQLLFFFCKLWIYHSPGTKLGCDHPSREGHI